MKTDNSMTKAWAEVYNGTDTQDMYREDEQPITDITVGRIQTHQKQRSRPRRVGRYHTQQAHRHSTTMAGDNAQWPRQITKAHTTCIPKESQASHDPLAHKVLLIMSRIYRQWASMRFKLGTMDSSMGIAADVRWSPGAGSRTSLVAALALWNTGGQNRRKRQGVPQTCTNASISTILRVAGIPKRILTPHVSIMEALRIRNSLTVGYGAPHTRRRGIPQGRPFSMTLTAYGQTLNNSSSEKRSDTKSACGRELHESHQKHPHVHHHS